MPTSTLTSKGQTTIPKEIREALHLQPGDRLEFILEGEDRVTLRPATADLTALDGWLDRSAGEPVSVEAMDEVIEDAVSESMRSTS